jgi:restriction system protein
VKYANAAVTWPGRPWKKAHNRRLTLLLTPPSAFNKQFIPVFLAANPDKNKIGAGLACGALWTVAKGIRKGDIVLCPDGAGACRVGEVTGDYQYAPDQMLPHRRPVQWMNLSIGRIAMSDPLKNSTGFIGTVCDISGYRDEI